MPDIRPFRGIFYNQDRIKNLAKVVTEPYDVINAVEQKAYYRRHPYNIIRLILGKRYRGDTGRDNPYIRANRFFTNWQKQDILLRDDEEVIYIYTQTFPYNHKRKTRTGMIVLLKLEDSARNIVLPHEDTFSRPVHERLKLLKAVQANLSPIFGLFSDEQGKINKLLKQYKRNHQPCIALEKDKVLHRLWRMNDKKKIARIQRLLKGRQVFIADGHHRYEAALNYKIQMQKKKKRGQKKAPFDYIMTCLVSTSDPGLTVLPTHRVVKVTASFKPKKIIKDLRKFFTVNRFTRSRQLFSFMQKRKSGCVFGAYFGKGSFYGLKLKDANLTHKFLDKNISRIQKSLDVIILHSLIIEGILNVIPFEDEIYYTRDVQEATELVDGKRYQAAFFLHPTTVTQLKKAARAGYRLPHKSTYFYPKLLTGLVIHKLNDKSC